MKSKCRSIPNLELEPINQHCPNAFNHKRHLFKNFRYNQSLNSQSSSTKSDYNYVRDESCSIFDVISVSVPYLFVEVDEDDMYPSKARSQRWPMPNKVSSIPNVVWYQTGCCSIDESLPLAIEMIESIESKEQSHLSKNNNPPLAQGSLPTMDDLWECAGTTLDGDNFSETPNTDNDRIIDFVQEKVNIIIEDVVHALDVDADDETHEIIEYDRNIVHSFASSIPASPNNVEYDCNNEPSYFSCTIDSASPPPPPPNMSSSSSDLKNVPVRSKNNLWTFLNLDNDDFSNSDPDDSPFLPPVDQAYIDNMLASVRGRQVGDTVPPCRSLCEL